MKYALISPMEPRATGCRVAQVSDAPFDVARPLFWVECADDTNANTDFYSEGVIASMFPAPPPVEGGPNVIA